MAFVAIGWTYKEEATKSKLQQMVDNLLAHDHRADGSQGAALVGDWVNLVGVIAPSAGWALVAGYAQRYRPLLGGALVEYDLAVTRTGADLIGGAAAASKPGGTTDTNVLTGLPAGAHSLANLVTEANNTIVCIRCSNATLVLTCMVTSGNVGAGDVMVIRDVVWRA